MAQSVSDSKIEKVPQPASRNGEARSAAIVKADLQRAEDRLQRHIRHLRREMSLGDVTVAGSPMLDHVRRHPFLALGIAVGGAAGLMLLLARLFRGDESQDEREVQDLANALWKELSSKGASREQIAEAVRKVLGGRGPVVVIAPDRGKGSSGGILGAALRAGVSSAMGVAAKTLTESLAGGRGNDRG